MPDDTPPVLVESVALEPVDGLVPHPQNPRQGDVGAVMESITANGFFAPCVVQRSTRHVLVGNHRLLAARQLDMAEVPVVWVDVDDERALRILLADNRTSDLGAYDDGALAALLVDLSQTSEAGLAGSAWDADALDSLIADLNAVADVTLGEPVEAPAPRRDGFEGRCPRCGYPDGEVTPET